MQSRTPNRVSEEDRWPDFHAGSQPVEEGSLRRQEAPQRKQRLLRESRLCPFEELKEVQLIRKLTWAELVSRKSHSRLMEKGLRGGKSGVKKTGLRSFCSHQRREDKRLDEGQHGDRKCGADLRQSESVESADLVVG